MNYTTGQAVYTETNVRAVYVDEGEQPSFLPSIDNPNGEKLHTIRIASYMGQENDITVLDSEIKGEPFLCKLRDRASKRMGAKVTERFDPIIERN